MCVLGNSVSRGLGRWLIHYTVVTLDTSHYLTNVKYTRHFGILYSVLGYFVVTVLLVKIFAFILDNSHSILDRAEHESH